jgi:tRNA pseudouridine55 synthase
LAAAAAAAEHSVDGLVVVDKPSGWTSHDVVARCRRIFGQKKVGHAGTLDPDATGVLLVGLGRVTRLLRFLTALSKSYTGEVVFGVATSTLDASGEVTSRCSMDDLTLPAAQEAARGLTGTISQVPPMVSAVRVGGRRLHDLARQGIEVERPSRQVTVRRFDVGTASHPDPGPLGGGPVFGIEVDCSSGTYIRTLAADLGLALGGCAHLRHLRRTAVGSFTEAEAVDLDQVGPGRVIDPAGALRGLPVARVDATVAAAVGCGRVLDRAELGVVGPGPWAVQDAGGDLLAVYESHRDDRVKPAVVLSDQPAPSAHDSGSR